MPRSTGAPSDCRPPASPPAAPSSPRRRSAGSAGWRTPPCSRASGSTTSCATTSSSRRDRLTLSDAFKRAGWRTVGDVPSNNRTWPQGTSFYHYDKLYDRRNVGYRGPKFSYASMPDQYVLAALQRLELAKTRPPPRLRGGRPGVEPHAVDAHPPADRLERRRRRLDLQAACRSDQLTRSELFGDLDAGARGVRPVHRVHAERPRLVRAALRRRQSRARRPRRPSALEDHHRGEPESRRADLGHRPRPGGARTGSPAGAGRTACGPARTRRSGRWTPSATASSAHSARSRRDRRRGPAVRPVPAVAADGRRWRHRHGRRVTLVVATVGSWVRTSPAWTSS